MRTLSVASLMLSSSLALSGCGLWPTTPPSAPGCDVQFNQGGSWSIAGVDIPINSPLFGGPVKIGTVTYTGADYSKISDTIRTLDQARLGYCSLTASSNFSQLSSTVKDSIFLNAAASYKAIVQFGTGLKTANNSEDGLQTQKEAEEKAKKLNEDLKSKGVGSSVDTETKKDVSKLQDDIKGILGQVNNLTSELQEIRGAGIKNIKVGGFESSGASLLAAQRTVLISEFRRAIISVPSGRIPNVLVIGYADSSGNQALNTELGLRRANNVVEYLRRTDFGRIFLTQITSGGVAASNDPSLARHVEIIISTALQNGELSGFA